MIFSIITPSFGQLDWLRMCIASVADQNEPKEQEHWKGDGTQYPAQSLLTIEHMIQDGGTPGIERFAQQFGAELKSRYGGDFVSDLQTHEILHLRTASGYALRVFKEPDAGMYDAINKGIVRISGDLWAWINSDEQYLPGTLAYVAKWFERNPDEDILCGDALLTDQEGNALSYRRIVSPLWAHTRLVHLSSLSCASFYRRSVIERVGGFDMAWRSIGDAEWITRVIQAKIRIRASSSLFSTFAFTGQNTSESPVSKQEAQRWSEMPGAPSDWLKLPVILHHRVRKWLAGAYAKRSVKYAIYGRNVAERLDYAAHGIGWGWHSGGKNWSGQSDPESGVHDAQTIQVLGTGLLATTYQGLSELLLDRVRHAKEPIVVDFANTQIVTMRRHDPQFARLAQSVDIAVPDGMPLVWVMNAKGAGLEDRVYGPTFTRDFLASCPAGMTHYLVGGSEECGRRFCERMKQLNPVLEFVGGYHGPCSTDGILEKDEHVLADIREKRPDFIWVGLGTPKQYAWINRIKPHLDRGVLLAVGFAFDVNAGMKPDAPFWMQRIGLTWIYRMASEPQRLMTRYLKWNTLFLIYFLGDTLAGRRGRFSPLP